MTDESRDVVAQLSHLLDQATDTSTPVLPRIATVLAAQPYLDTLLRLLVTEARDAGATWEELADVFVTTPASVRSRFGTYRQYDDED